MNITCENATATFFLWIASSDRNGHNLFDPRPQSAFALLCLRRDGSTFGSQTSNGSSAAEDYNARALIIGAIEGISHLPDKASVHIISDQNWIIGVFNEDRKLRMARDYNRSNGSSKYAYENDWRKFDACCELMSITVTAGRPLTESSKSILSSVKVAASQCARNIGTPHSDWDV